MKRKQTTTAPESHAIELPGYAAQMARLAMKLAEVERELALLVEDKGIGASPPEGMAEAIDGITATVGKLWEWAGLEVGLLNKPATAKEE